MNYAAGVRPNAYGVDNRGDYVRIRGVEPAQYLDGLRQFFNYNNPRTEIYGMERVEVLRGPSSMLYGQGSTGGIVNLVSKRPQAEAQREIGVVLGNDNRREIQADLTGPVTEDGSARARRPPDAGAFPHVASQRRHLADLAGPVAKGQGRHHPVVPALERIGAGKSERPHPDPPLRQ
ncbi:hypothetical protein G6F57_020912 [Rhizopus arrhizus]|nr:hypothetical protein G6F57_020912 [Rhizopus arrhizus]